jgi:5-methylthioadenosine/S-adenosylhomocysteine deaminase
VTTGDPKVVSAIEALELATVRGARALHLEKEIGSLEEGKRADLIVVDMDDLNQIPIYNVYSQLVYATKAADVRTVVVEGRVLMRDRKLLTLDEATIKRDARAWRERIARSLAPAASDNSASAAATKPGEASNKKQAGTRNGARKNARRKP